MYFNITCYVAIMITNNYSLACCTFFFFKLLFMFNFCIVVGCVVIFSLNRYVHNITAIKEKSFIAVTKNILISNLIINILLMGILFYYILFLHKQCVLELLTTGIKYMYIAPRLQILWWSFDLDIYNIIFYMLSIFVAFISLLSLDTRLYGTKLIFLVLCNLLVFVIFLFSFTNNYVLFFLFYEFLLIPSFFFVYRISPAKTAIQSSIYFVMWTQIGSFLVFLAIIFCIVLTNTYEFINLATFKFTEQELLILQYLLFFGFGIKIPVWPFHYWITKTHVDAPTGFSIFLSGFLVKTALFGFYKFSIVLGFFHNNIIFSTICLLGVVDASMKMWGQTDLKKLVAYATIQEMGLVYLTLCFGDTTAIIGGFIFCVTHAFLSSIFFFLVDTISRRFYTRNITEINGILHLTPTLGIMVLLSCIFYSGLPGTLKFISEIYLFAGLVDVTPLSAIFVLFIANFFGLIGFSKVWFNVVFGMTLIPNKFMVMDLSSKELYTLIICYVGLFSWGFIIPNFI